MKDSTKDKIEGSTREVKGSLKRSLARSPTSLTFKLRVQDEKVAGKGQKKVGDVEKVFEEIGFAQLCCAVTTATAARDMEGGAGVGLDSILIIVLLV